MYRYRCIVEYDGTAYYGWQLQPELPSITGALQASFAQVFDQVITIAGASRTDAGVHALGQVATFTCNQYIAPDKMRLGWNHQLPTDIVIRSIELVPLEHNIFADIVYKTYVYHIFLHRPSPLYRRYGWYYPRPFDHDKLYAVLHQLIGTHDFTSLCAADTPDPHKIRTIVSVTLEHVPAWKALAIQVRGERFLRHMIRRVVGAAVKIASTPTLSIDYIHDIIDARNPNNPLHTAPAQGLLLHHITYKKDTHAQ